MSDSISKFVGASNHVAGDRDRLDYYATWPRETERLLEHETFDHNVLEPACGGGHMAEVLKAKGYNVTSSDIQDYGYGMILDFFNIDYFHGDVVTNPPYVLADKFIQHSLDIIPDGNKVAMLLRLNFLESRKRQELFQKHPPKTVYVAVERMRIAKNGNFEDYKVGAIAYAWFVWEKGYKGATELSWC